MKENLKLRKELEEMKKENDFLKKRQHSSRKGAAHKVFENLLKQNFTAYSPD